ncbi:MAG: alkaline phosphatase family protein [Erysipelotrichaceae bacterium]|nr:alkaline phosphatase family protein [Erysipelotrichaceae bacterium]
MIVRNDYTQCITNVACSIQRYFGIEPAHETLSDLDEILERKQPQNVILILYDGMGSRILERNMPADCFFLKNRLRDITSVFPATTTAATTSVICGLNPVEHGFLGWNCYIPPLDRVITLFRYREKGHQEICQEFIDMFPSFNPKRIIDQINEKGEDAGYGVSPFMEYPYETYDEMLEKIRELAERPGRKYMYVYDSQPDTSMHLTGPDSAETVALIRERDEKTEQLCRQLHDAVVIVLADHGHKAVENVLLDDHPELTELMERPASIEPRAVSFKVKDGCHGEFERRFRDLFGEDFVLYPAEEVIKSGLFGTGKEHPYFRQQLGDYLAISYGNKCIVDGPRDVLASQHAGYTDDEIYIPLIVISCD